MKMLYGDQHHHQFNIINIVIIIIIIIITSQIFHTLQKVFALTQKHFY